MLLLWLLFILDRPIDGLQSANLFAFLLSALLYILTTFLKNLQFKKMFARFYYRFLHLRLPTVNFALHSFLFDAIYGSDHTLFRSSSLVIISFCLPILVQLSVSVCRLQLIACRVVLHQGQAIVLLPQPKQCSRTVHKASWHYRRFSTFGQTYIHNDRCAAAAAARPSALAAFNFRSQSDRYNRSICLVVSSYALHSSSLTINTHTKSDSRADRWPMSAQCRDVGLIENVNVLVRLWGRINTDSIIFIVSSFFFISSFLLSAALCHQDGVRKRHQSERTVQRVGDTDCSRRRCWANPVCKLPTFT